MGIYDRSHHASGIFGDVLQMFDKKGLWVKKCCFCMIGRVKYYTRLYSLI